MTATALLSLGLLLLPAAAGEDDPLLGYRGSPLILEFPALEDVGRSLVVPHGWEYLQVTTAMYDSLAHHLEPGHPEALVYFDAHGNPILRDHSRERRVQLSRSTARADRRVTEWRRRGKRGWNESQRARKENDAEGELEALLALKTLGVRGYEEFEAAHARLDELEGERLAELWQILAGEGIDGRRLLETRLARLYEYCRGLEVGSRVRRERDRVDRGWVVRPRTSPR